MGQGYIDPHQFTNWAMMIAHVFCAGLGTSQNEGCSKIQFIWSTTTPSNTPNPERNNDDFSVLHSVVSSLQSQQAIDPRSSWPPINYWSKGEGSDVFTKSSMSESDVWPSTSLNSSLSSAITTALPCSAKNSWWSREAWARDRSLEPFCVGSSPLKGIYIYMYVYNYIHV